MSWFIYILLCDKKSYYVGLSSNVLNREKSHASGYNIATKEFFEIELVYTEEYRTRTEAERREDQLKGWSAAKKKALIARNKELLIKLSKYRSPVKGSTGK